MLQRLFTSKSRVKILELLLMSPDSEFHIRDIARKIKVTPIYVSKELSNLEKIGIVAKTNKANLVLFKANRKSPIFDELKKIFIKTEGLGKNLSNMLKDQEVKFALIYGSVAKGEEKENSDIDLIIIGNVEERQLLKSVKENEKKLGREINYILWSEKEFLEKARKKNNLLESIIKNPVIMLVGDYDEFKRHVKG